MFYEFINDMGDIRGITLIALYADLSIYKSMVSEARSEGEKSDLNKQAQTIYHDYIITNNTYEMETNEIIDELRQRYI